MDVLHYYEEVSDDEQAAMTEWKELRRGIDYDMYLYSDNTKFDSYEC